MPNFALLTSHKIKIIFHLQLLDIVCKLNDKIPINPLKLQVAELQKLHTVENFKG